MEEVSLPLVEVRTRLLEVCLGVREHGIVTGLCTTVCDVYLVFVQWIYTNKYLSFLWLIG